MDINHSNTVIAGESNIGLNRSHNEDNFLVFTPPGGEAVLGAVADGIGGHGYGEMASYICCRELYRMASRVNSRNWDETLLHDTLACANKLIFERNFSEHRERPMGCTVIAAIFFRDRVITAFAGDSRIYEYDPENKLPFRQLSTDHRPQKKEGRHYLKDEYSNFVCRSLGTQLHVEIEMKTFSRPAKARYLLCSDGLYSVVPEQLLAGVMGAGLNIRQTTATLMRNALLSGVGDNVSLICAGAQDMEA